MQPAATCTWNATANAYAAGRRAPPAESAALEGLVDGEAREPEHGQGTVRQPSPGLTGNVVAVDLPDGDGHVPHHP